MMDLEAVRKEVQEIADRVLSPVCMTAKEAAEIIDYLSEKYPINTDAGKLCDKIMIDTGAGESLYMLMQFANMPR